MYSGLGTSYEFYYDVLQVRKCHVHLSILAISSSIDFLWRRKYMADLSLHATRCSKSQSRVRAEFSVSCQGYAETTGKPFSYKSNFFRRLDVFTIHLRRQTLHMGVGRKYYRESVYLQFIVCPALMAALQFAQQQPNPSEAHSLFTCSIQQYLIGTLLSNTMCRSTLE